MNTCEKYWVGKAPETAKPAKKPALGIKKKVKFAWSIEQLLLMHDHLTLDHSNGRPT
jgi:hypothetical protein